MSDPQREALVNVLVMSPMADHVFGSLDPISRTADVILFSGFIAQVKAEARAEAAEEVAGSIEGLEHTSEERDRTTLDGFSMDWVNGYDQAVHEATRIARDHGGEQP